ncbi:hypothetical protein ACO0LG_28365 [Undibacterium sp. Ji42W]|uniref:hypothetical protein n=1 Tax=Undibacterium sp. Ji42W TaxID=3413039 RepID=UPI003BF14C44
MIIKQMKYFSLFLASIVLSGCALVAPPYTSSQVNAQLLEDAGASKVKVGEFGNAKYTENANPVALRGGRMHSPYQESFSTYLEEALKTELTASNQLDQKSAIEISGILRKNDMTIPVFDPGLGIMEVQFIVKSDGLVKFDKVKSVKHNFESAFSGDVAISRAISEYKYMVQKLLKTLFSDQDFKKAINK